MQKIELSMELTEGEVQRIKEREKEMGLNEGQLLLLALVVGLQGFGVDISNTDPLSLIADDV